MPDEPAEGLGTKTPAIEAPPLERDALLELGQAAFPIDAVAIVTGAGSGIGRAVAAALAANGLTVAGLDIDEEGLARTSTVIHEFDVDGSFVEIVCNLTDIDDSATAVEQSADLGELRFLANIAGVQHIAALGEFPIDRYNLLSNLMLRAPFHLTSRVMPHIASTADGRGAIANMSSVHGRLATRDKSAYITAKHGLNGLTRAIAAEGRGTIRGFTVSVGYVLTPLMVDQIQATAEARGLSEQTVVEEVMLGPARTKRMMTAAEVANLFVFGFSDHADHLNGGDLLWDGGFTTTYE